MSDVSTAKPTPWGLVATFGWLVLTVAIAQIAAVAGLFVWFGEDTLARVSVFRGFMFRGWVRPGGNPIIAIVVISTLWAIQHVQYEWFGLLQVFVLGILFGVIRWKSGSTLLTFALHALINVEAGIETVIKVEWM